LQYRIVLFLEYVARWIEAGRQIREDAARATDILRNEPGVQWTIGQDGARKQRR